MIILYRLKSMCICFGLTILHSTAFADTPLSCSEANQQNYILSESQDDITRRIMLVHARCTKNVLTMLLEGRAVLRLRLCDQNIKPFDCTKISIEGGIDQVLKPYDLTLRTDGLNTHLSAKNGKRFTISPSADLLPLLTVKKIVAPMMSYRGKSFSEKKLPRVGRFGAVRLGKRLHTAVDLKAQQGVKVFAPGNGIVVFISHLPTQSTVYLKHKKEDGTFFYTALAHLKDIHDTVGKVVSEQTVLGRAMNATEMAKTKHHYNHIHFEVRRTLKDLGNYSIDTRNSQALEKNFVNPSLVLNGHSPW